MRSHSQAQVSEGLLGGAMPEAVDSEARRERHFGEEDQSPGHLVSFLHLEGETLSRKQKHRAETQICFLFTYQ